MRLSEVIATLQQYQQEVGDVELVSIFDMDQGFVIESGQLLEIVEIPTADEASFETVVALLDPSLEDEFDMPLKNKKPKLSLVK